LHQENPIIRIANALVSVSIDDFDSRLKLQKIGFLAQEMGADIGFTFNWYRRGPYSPSLTRTLYSAEELGLLKITNPQLSAPERKIANDLRELLGGDLENPKALELIASVWYLIPGIPQQEEDKEHALDVLVEQKPQFTRDELREGLDRVVAFRSRYGKLKS
jgi:uncharacterized protein YwgA